MSPMISVLMPLFNGADTVLTALASLQAQTCHDWECIVVDDGSTDDSAALVQAVYDRRIKLYRLEHNRGRGYARQCCLQNASGKYVAFLDADDWIYPDKLRQQVELMEAEPGTEIVSTGMLITDTAGNLVGVRHTCPDDSVIHPPMRRLGMPPLAFAPTMMATDLARKTAFDPSFPTAEDVEFLLRAISGRSFGILPAPLYVYREQGAATLEKTISALNQCCRMFKKQSRFHPVASNVEIAKVRAKQIIYYVAAASGGFDKAVARRSRLPNQEERAQHLEAWRQVSQVASTYTTAVCSYSNTQPNHR